jgi:hypothetical protein
MSDFLVFMAALLGTYLFAVGFVIAMVRVFFPLKTEEEWQKIKVQESAGGERQLSKLRRVPRAVISDSRQLA